MMNPEKTMSLRLNGLAVDCILGDLPSERECPRRVTVDLELEIVARAAETDELSDTVDYAALSEAVRAALVSARCRMVERAARLACEAALVSPLVLAAAATVTKAGAVPNLASASATYRSGR